jgi:hypothetical protein
MTERRRANDAASRAVSNPARAGRLRFVAIRWSPPGRHAMIAASDPSSQRA